MINSSVNSDCPIGGNDIDGRRPKRLLMNHSGDVLLALVLVVTAIVASCGRDEPHEESVIVHPKPAAPSATFKKMEFKRNAFLDPVSHQPIAPADVKDLS